MFAGGDGYVVLAGGTDVLHPGDPLLDVVVDEITLRSERWGRTWGASWRDL